MNKVSACISLFMTTLDIDVIPVVISIVAILRMLQMMQFAKSRIRLLEAMKLFFRAEPFCSSVHSLHCEWDMLQMVHTNTVI